MLGRNLEAAFNNPPPEVNKNALSLLQAGYTSGAIEGIKSEQRELLTRYLTTGATLDSLIEDAGVTTRDGVSKVMRRSLIALHRQLPPDLQARFDLSQLGRLKKTIPTPEQAAKATAALKVTGLSGETKAHLSEVRMRHEVAGSTRAILRQARLGRSTISDEGRASIVRANAKREITDEMREHLTRIAFLKSTPSDETRSLLSEAGKRRTVTPSTGESIVQTRTERRKNRKLVDEDDRQLWEAVQGPGTIKDLIQGGYLSALEVSELSRYFNGEFKKVRSPVLDRLSFGIVELIKSGKL